MFRLLAVAFVAVFATALAAAPAQAALSNPQSLYIQLRSSETGGGTLLVGEAVGTVQFDSGNSIYRLSVTVCRQGSYTFPNFDLYVNGTVRQAPFPFQGNLRPQDCSTAYPYYNGSASLDGDFQFNGTIQNLKICLQGVHFTYPPPKYPQKCVTFDNPHN